MAIVGNSNQCNYRIFQARQFQAIPGKGIRYKKIPDNFRQDILGMAFSRLTPRRFQSFRGKLIAGTEVTGNSREHNSWLGNSTHVPIKKFLESQQQAISGKANPKNTMLGKTIPGNYKKRNSKKKNY